MLDIERYRSDIEAAAREFDLRGLDLVGSATRSDFSDTSDVDLLVTFKGDHHLFDRYFGLKERLESIFLRRVDLIEERALKNPYLLRSLNKSRMRIYGT